VRPRQIFPPFNLEIQGGYGPSDRGRRTEGVAGHTVIFTSNWRLNEVCISLTIDPNFTISAILNEIFMSHQGAQPSMTFVSSH